MMNDQRREDGRYGESAVSSDIHMVGKAKWVDWKKHVWMFVGVALFCVVYFCPSFPDAVDPQRTALTIEGTERLLINYASCCHPIPGDNIIGTTTSGRGLVVHRSNCANSKAIMRQPDNYFHLNWSEETQGHFQVEVRVETRNEPGVLATISNIIAENDSNINNVSVTQYHQTSSEMAFTIGVTNRDNLANILRQIRIESTVIKVARS